MAASYYPLVHLDVRRSQCFASIRTSTTHEHHRLRAGSSPSSRLQSNFHIILHPFTINLCYCFNLFSKQDQRAKELPINIIKKPGRRREKRDHMPSSRSLQRVLSSGPPPPNQGLLERLAHWATVQPNKVMLQIDLHPQ